MVLTQELVNTLIEANPGGCIAYQLIEDKLIMLGFSEELATFSGYAHEELVHILSADPFAIIYEDDKLILKNMVYQCINGENNLNCTYRVVQQNTDQIWVLCRGKFIGTLNDKPVMFATIQYNNSAGNQLDFVNKMPIGAGIIKFSAETLSSVFLNDGYYEMLNMNRIDRNQYLDINAIKAIHPNDRMKFLNAVSTAVSSSGLFQVIVRVLVNDINSFHWLQLDGKIVEQTESEQIFYVTFTKIDQVLQITNDLEINKTSLEAALSASKQTCCEYDPRTQTLTVKTGSTRLFGLPAHIHNFPQSLIDKNIIYPYDSNLLLETLGKLSSGTKRTQCDIRLHFMKQYRWFSCCFQLYYDRAKHYNVAICNFSDCTLQHEAIHSYKNHLDTIIKLNPDSIATFRMNLSKNICGDGTSTYYNISILRDSGTVEGFFHDAEQFIDNLDEREQFHQTFQIDNLIQCYQNGDNTISLKHVYELEPNNFEWLESTINIICNPHTGDIEAILYIKNISTMHIENLILKETLEEDYTQIAILHVKHNEYFLFDNSTNKYCAYHDNFWESGIWSLVSFASDDDMSHLHQVLSKDYITATLHNSKKYSISFHAKSDSNKRYLISFSYAYNETDLVIVTVRDITDEALLSKLSYDADHDALTGIYNRTKSYTECDKLLKAHPDETFAIVHFDIQKFRLYNSFFGAEEGDKLLQYIANMFRGLYHTHKYGVYGRIEADVFFLCFPFREDVIRWNETYIHNKLMQYRKDFYLSGTSGVYISQKHTLPAEAMFNRALVAAKSNNHKHMKYVSFYDDSIDKQIAREQRIAGEMRSALKDKQFTVYLQPKYDTTTGKPYGAEALVRWIHPVHGIIPPDDFIPLFERNGFITTLDQYMWESVCVLLRKWIDDGINPAPISVNVSRVSMYSPETVTFLSDLVQKYNIDAALLNLELTETAYMDNPTEMKERLTSLQNIGFKIMMDDFGSGYSSLNTLRELPFDYMKVDRLFLSTIEQDTRSRTLLASVVDMANKLNVPVIAEGVETEQQRSFLETIHCDYIQGYLFAKPMPVRDYEENILTL